MGRKCLMELYESLSILIIRKGAFFKTLLLLERHSLSRPLVSICDTNLYRVQCDVANYLLVFEIPKKVVSVDRKLF
jgi:hypothetical protein